MANHSHNPVEVDSKQLQDTATFWHDFTHFGKYAVIGVIAVLLALGFFFI